MNKSYLAAICLASLAAAGSVQAQLLSESFSYADGNLTTVSGGAWVNHSGTGSFIQVTSESAILNGGSGSREDVNRVLGSSYTSGTLYASFTVNLTGTAPTTGSTYFFMFKDDTATNFRGRVYLAAPSSSGFRLGLENDASDNASSVKLTSDLSTSVSHTVTIAYDITAGTSKLWVDTATSNAPTLEDTTAATALSNGLSSVALRQASVAYTGLAFDNLNVTVVPEPSEWAALAGAGLIGFAMLRRRNK